MTQPITAVAKSACHRTLVFYEVHCEVASACCCERNWSTFEFIRSKKRNRLEPAHANDLVYVFTNLRLIKQVKSLEYEQDFSEWDSDDQ